MMPVYSPQELSGAHVWVIGMARSGVAAARLLKEHGTDVFVSELRPEAEVRDEAGLLRDLGIEVQTGGHRLDGRQLPSFTVISPGIPPDAEAITFIRGKGVPCYSEIEVASWFFKGMLIAVTGSNGKTTVVKWIEHLFREAGYNASAAGNIGYPFCDLVREHPETVYAVIEVSSYQLETVSTFHPHIAIVTNISPDHLERYESIEDYAEVKARIWTMQTDEDWAVFPLDDEIVVGLTEKIHSRKSPVSLDGCPEYGAGVDDGVIVFDTEIGPVQLLNMNELPIPGRHNVKNALVTALTAWRMGVKRKDISAGLRSFPGVPHRLEVLIRDGGVWINDSKATNVGSLEVALEAVEGPVWLIAGGRDKGASYAPVRQLVSEKVRRMLLIGEGAKRMEDELGDLTTVTQCGHLENAVSLAKSEAREGVTVLLSPGCASFDQFRDFEERGETFRRLVTGSAR